MSFSDHELLEQMPHLRRFAISLVKDREQADDLVQDCLVRALANKTSFEAGTNLRSWLFTILHNIFIDNHRRRRGFPIATNAHEAIEGVRVESRQDNKILWNELNSAVATLPKVQRYVLLLVAIEGYSYQEVAEITGVAVGTVKSRLSRARATLRDEFYLSVWGRSETSHDQIQKADQRHRTELSA